MYSLATHMDAVSAAPVSISASAIGVYFHPGMKLEDIEKLVILETLKHQRFNRTHAAKILGIGIRTLQRKLKQYRLDPSAQIDG